MDQNMNIQLGELDHGSLPKQFQGLKSKYLWIINQVIIDTVWAIIRLAQREGSTPVAPPDCGTSHW